MLSENEQAVTIAKDRKEVLSQVLVIVLKIMQPYLSFFLFFFFSLLAENKLQLNI